MKKKPIRSTDDMFYHSLFSPDRNISKQLREIDRGLYARWNWMRERWEIWYKKDLRPDVLVTILQDDKGRYLPLDQRIIRILRKADTHRYNRVQDFMYEIESKEERAEEIRQKDNLNKIHGITTHFDGQMRGATTRQVPDRIG